MITGLKPYSSTKDSAVPWLGTVPAHWERRRLKSLLRAIDRRSSTGIETLLSLRRDHGIVVYSEHFSRPAQGATTVGYKMVNRGQLVVNRLQANNGLVFDSSLDGLVSPDYSVFETRGSDQIVMPYLSLMLRTPTYRDHFRRESTGLGTGSAGFLRLYDDRLLETPVVLPPTGEQASILRFLDHADRRIRRYIRAKQKLIKLLEEKKRATINYAITRGLDPNVGVKSSGVSSLGNVPAHWEVIRFKRRVGFQEGPGIMASDFRQTGVPLLRISCLAGDTATLQGCNFLDLKTVQRRWSHFAVRSGDYLLSASASTGHVVLATDTVAGAIPYTGILRLWPLSTEVFMPFVQLYIESAPFQAQIDIAKSGVAIEHFGPTHLKRMFIALPPPDEQRALVTAVQHELQTPARAVLRLKREIELVREYRVRLTADAVTGKVDVREMASQLPDEVENVEPIDEAEVDGAEEAIAAVAEEAEA